MSDFLTAVKTVHKSSQDVPKDLLTAVSTRHRQKTEPSQQLYEPTQDRESSGIVIQKPGVDLNELEFSPEGVLEILRSEPDVDLLVRALKRIQPQNDQHNGFNIHQAGPLQAQIIHALTHIVIPTFWPTLELGDQTLIVTCLLCVAGIQAVVARLRLPLQTADKLALENGMESLKILLAVLDRLLTGDDTILTLWSDLMEAENSSVKRKLQWKETVNVVASGRIIAAAAQAEDTINANGERLKPSWLSIGSEYATWLGRNTITMLYDNARAASDSVNAAAQVLTKALSLGYSSPLASAIVVSFLDRVLDHHAKQALLRELLETLAASSRRVFLEQVLRWLSDVSPGEGSLKVEQLAKPSPEVSGIAALLSIAMEDSSFAAAQLGPLVTDSAVLSSFDITVRRALTAALSQHAPEEHGSVLDRAITHFSNRLFIDHAPIIQQEALAQVLLLVAGQVHRQSPMTALMSARSSGHMQGVSNRLSTPNQRSRWLGMVVGVAISSLVDKPGSRMNFGSNEMDTDETRWYLHLVSVNDRVGDLSQLRSLFHSRTAVVRAKRQTPTTKAPEMPMINGKRTFGPVRPPALVQTKIVGDRVTEVLDESDEDEDDDLKPYAKPDSDPEDSDEDATLVNRNKPQAPVYIRDLMKMLRDDKDHDRFQLGIKHAAKLIRRKSNFGNEVKDHSQELAGMLCGLQDPFDTENFDELRLQALIAVLLTDVPNLAPWLAGQAFTGDYSLSQRCIILSALGLGGRELAGFADDKFVDAELREANRAFPTKRLPSHLHQIYRSAHDATAVPRLEAASQRTEHHLIQPLALSAADDATAHLNAVKVRTFSSRIAVERTKRKPAANALAQRFADAFFAPLVTRYQRERAAYGSGSVFASASVLLSTFVKTLALLLHAAGPATRELPDVTVAFWDLLLSLRVPAVADVAVREAVLFALLTLLEVNADAKQRVARETARQLMETQRWVEVIFERTGGGGLIAEERGGGEEARVRTLAAGVLVRTKEVVEAYQKLLIGSVPGF